MAKARATFGKRERDRAKRERADLKRERRAERAAESTDDAAEEPVDTSGNDRILAAVAKLHERYEAGELDMETFEEERAELMSRLAIE
jgi:hypothetical protein